MTIRLSPELRTRVITNYGLGMLLNGGIVRLYSGFQRNSADLGAASPEIGQINPNTGTDGLQVMAGAAAGTLTNADAWDVVGSGTGTPAWWRWTLDGDDGTATDPGYIRLDGAIADCFPVGTFPPLTPGYTRPVASFLLYLPSN